MIPLPFRPSQCPRLLDTRGKNSAPHRILQKLTWTTRSASVHVALARLHNFRIWRANWNAKETQKRGGMYFAIALALLESDRPCLSFLMVSERDTLPSLTYYWISLSLFGFVYAASLDLCQVVFCLVPKFGDATIRQSLFSSISPCWGLWFSDGSVVVVVVLLRFVPSTHLTLARSLHAQVWLPPQRFERGKTRCVHLGTAAQHQAPLYIYIYNRRPC